MAIIGKIRKHSVITVGFVALALLAFIAGDIVKKSGRQFTNNIATVNGEDISTTEYNTQVSEYEARYKAQSQTQQISNEDMFRLREEVWNQMITQRLYDAEFAKLGLIVGQAELNDMFMGEFVHPYVKQNFTNPETGQFERQKVAQLVANFETFSPEQQQEWSNLEKYTKSERLQTKYTNLLLKAFYLPKPLVNTLAQLQANTSDLRYTVLGYDQISDSSVVLTKEDYQKFYEEHKKQYKQEDSRDIDYVIFTPTPTAEDLAKIQTEVNSTYEEFMITPDQEMKNFVNSQSDTRYDTLYKDKGSFVQPIDSLIHSTPVGKFIAPMQVDNQWMMAKVIKIANRPDSIRASSIIILNKNANESFARTEEEAKHLADSLLNLIKSGKSSFEEVLMNHSDDPEKQKNLGDMTWMPDGSYGFLNEKLVQTPLNEVFLVERPDRIGYHIIKVTGKSPETRKVQVALITRDIEPSSNTVKQVDANARGFLGKIASHTEMVEVAQKEGLMLRSADRTKEMSDRLAGLQNAREIVRWAYNEDRKVGDVSPEIYDVNGSFVVVALKAEHKKGYAPLEEVKTFIEQEVKNEKKAVLLMEKAKSALSASQDIESIAQKLNTVVDTITGVSFADYYFGKNGAEMRVLGSLPTLKINTLSKPIKGYSGVYILYVEAQQAAPAEKAQGMIQQMDAMNQQKARQIIEVLKEQATITDNRAIFF